MVRHVNRMDIANSLSSGIFQWNEIKIIFSVFFGNSLLNVGDVDY